MHKILILFLLIQTFSYASYNPFFSDEAPKQQPKRVGKTVVKEIEVKPRQNIDITYFGFVESTKGKFALVNFNKKNIVIKQNDALYLNELIYKVKKITSNYILFSDRAGRMQSVYFSSEVERQRQWQK